MTGMVDFSFHLGTRLAGLSLEQRGDIASIMGSLVALLAVRIASKIAFKQINVTDYWEMLNALRFRIDVLSSGIKEDAESVIQISELIEKYKADDSDSEHINKLVSEVGRLTKNVKNLEVKRKELFEVYDDLLKQRKIDVSNVN